jgi:hypothetical protein
VDVQLGDIADVDPLRRLRLDAVLARLTADHADVEAHRELLAYLAIVVCHDVAGVGVDADQARDLDAMPVSSSTSRTAASVTDSPCSPSSAPGLVTGFGHVLSAIATGVGEALSSASAQSS